jgi:hypothetical protein
LPIFDVSVRRIVAQPFLLLADVGGVVRRHVPDYLLFTEDGPVVVDVKPQDGLAKPVTAFTFVWTRAVVESRGWRYDVSSEPPQTELSNVRFLAGYRRDWLFDRDLLEELRTTDLDGPPWAMRVAACRRGRNRWCARRCCICCGDRSSPSI